MYQNNNHKKFWNVLSVDNNIQRFTDYVESCLLNNKLNDN